MQICRGLTIADLSQCVWVSSAWVHGYPVWVSSAFEHRLMADLRAWWEPGASLVQDDGGVAVVDSGCHTHSIPPACHTHSSDQGFTAGLAAYRQRPAGQYYRRQPVQAVATGGSRASGAAYRRYLPPAGRYLPPVASLNHYGYTAAGMAPTDFGIPGALRYTGLCVYRRYGESLTAVLPGTYRRYSVWR